MAQYNPDKLLLSEIRDKIEGVFGYRPCLWQIKVVRAILKRDRDVVSIAATGSGKTLTFWMPLLFIPDGIQIVVTPLNILGKQNVDSLAKVGISAITITADTATAENFQVRRALAGCSSVSNLLTCRPSPRGVIVRSLPILRPS
jgi:ATP-dependent DNA helicase RecQ